MKLKIRFTTRHVCLTAFLLFFIAAFAYPATVSDIIGARNALLCYSSGLDVRVRDLSNGNDWKITNRSVTTKQAFTGGINAGGDKLVFEDNGRNCVINLDGSSRQFITGLRTSNGTFWRDSAGNDWVVYSNEEESPAQSGTMWKVMINSATNIPVDSSRTLICGEQYSCGLGGSGRYAGEVYAVSFLYNIKTGKKSPLLYDTVSWGIPQSFYGSVHPGGKPWLMYSSGETLNSLVISQWIESSNLARTIWRYDYASGKIYGHWSSTDSLVCALVKDRQVFLASIAADTAGTSDNTGTFTEASTGLTLASETDFIIGGPWVGTRTLSAGTPIITPNGGLETADTVMVSMSSITDSTTIRYTLDKTAPSSGSTLFTGSLMLLMPDTGSVTLSAKAFRNGFAESSVATAVFTRLTLKDSVIAGPVEPGLGFDYYEGIFLYPSDILKDWANPCIKGFTDSFNIDMREREDQFGLWFYGYFRAPADGKYVFYCTSDDSSELFIDSEMIVATNYMWGTGQGTTGLKKGLHRIALLYQQGDGGKGLSVEYEGPQISRTAVPSTALFSETSLIKVTTPAVFDTVLTGEAVNVQWTADASVASVHIDASIGPEYGWVPLTSTAIPVSDASWGGYSWTVPESLSQNLVHNVKVSFRVRSASDSTKAGYASRRIMVINPLSTKKPAVLQGKTSFFRQTAPGIKISIPSYGQNRIDILTASGRLIIRKDFSTAGEYLINTAKLSAGVYILRADLNGVIKSRAFSLSR